MIKGRQSYFPDFLNCGKGKENGKRLVCFSNNLLRAVLFFCGEHGNMLHHLFEQFCDFRGFFQ